MDRFVVRTLDDFWALVEAHRGELALRDLGLRRKRAPHLDTAFEALVDLGLVPRWPSPAAMVDALRSETRALSWSASDLAKKVSISVRTAERVLASDHTPTFESTIRWADAVERPFYVDRDPSQAGLSHDAASPRTAPTPASPPGAAAVADRSVPSPSAATHPAAPDDTPVPGREAATDPAAPGDKTGHDEAPGVVDATDPPWLTATSGPPSAHRSPPPTQAADPDDRSGPGPGAPLSEPGALALDDLPQETGLFDHDRGGQPIEEDAVDPPIQDSRRGPSIDTSGPTSLATRASTPDSELADDVARKEDLRSPSGQHQAQGMMVTVEWRRDDEVIFHGKVARDQVRETVRKLAKLPSYADAHLYIDGRRYRKKKKRRRTEDLGAQFGAQVAAALRPVLEGQRALAERQAAMELQTKVSRELAEGLKDLATQIATIQPPSFLALVAKSLYDEFMPEEPQ